MGYTKITAHVTDQTLQLTNTPKLASGGVDEVQVEFSFCDLWAGATKKTAVFYRDVAAVYHVDLENDACIAPWEVFATKGKVFMGVFAEYTNGTTRTSEVLALSVDQGAITTQNAPAQAPDIYAALEARVAALERNPGSGTVSTEQIAQAVRDYMAEHPATFGDSLRVAEIELLAANWTGESNLFSQVVAIDGVTENSQVDLTPSVEQLAVFYDKDITFVTENDGGVVTVYVIGQKPQNDYTIQANIVEVLV